MIPQGCAMEAPQNQVLVHAVTTVPDGDILDHTEVCPQDVFCPGPHLLVVAEHNPRPDIPHPSFSGGEQGVNAPPCPKNSSSSSLL